MGCAVSGTFDPVTFDPVTFDTGSVTPVVTAGRHGVRHRPVVRQRTGLSLRRRLMEEEWLLGLSEEYLEQ